MSDQIISVKQNDDGSFLFGFLFDGGNGIAGNTNIVLPASTDPDNPYNLATAKAAVLPIASQRKAEWLATFTIQQIIGNVTL